MPGISLFLLLALWQAPLAPRGGEDQVSVLLPIHIPKGAVAGDAVCILCSIRVDGALQGEAVAVWGDVIVSGSVAGEAVAAGGSVRLLSGSRLQDEAVAVGGRVARDPGSAVAGRVTQVAYLYFPGQRSWPWPGAALFAVLGLGILLAASGLLRPIRGSRLKSALARRPLSVLLLGIGAVVLMTALGTATPLLGPLEDPADLGLVILLLVPSWLGSIGLVRLLGDRLFPSRPGRSVVAGSLLVVLVLMIPLLGLAALALVVILGWGVAAISGIGSDVEWLARRLRRKAAPAGSEFP